MSGGHVDTGQADSQARESPGANAFVCAWNGSSGIASEQVCCLYSVSALVIVGAMRVFRQLWSFSRDRGGNVPTVPVYRYASVEDYIKQWSIGGSYVSVNCSVADLVRYSLDNGHFEGHVVTSAQGQSFYRSIPRFALARDVARKHFWMTADYRHAEAS